MAKIFTRDSEIVEAVDDSVDLYFSDLLANILDALVQTQNDLLIELIEVLVATERMSNTLSLLLDNTDRVMNLFTKALQNGKVSFVELILELEFININDKIKFSSSESEQTLVSAMFGRIESSQIIRLIQKFQYDFSTSNNSSINPEGDSLLAALNARDLKSFKKLLILGASLNVLVGDKNQLLEDFVRENEKEFFDAIQSFKNGTLSDEIAAEEANELEAPYAVLSKLDE